MKKMLIASVIILLISCYKTEKNLPDLTKEEVTGKRLWDRITKEDNYKKYPMWPDHEGMHTGNSPHGRYNKVFINHKLRKSLPIADKIAPYGSIIVKENYSTDKEFGAYTVMVKVKDYSHESNDWFWAKYSKDGEILAEGKVSMCISCHSASKTNDYIILQRLDKPIK